MTGHSRQGEKGIPGWVWILALAIPLGYLLRQFLWWLLCPSYQRTSAVEIEAPRSPLEPQTQKTDDLTLIKGIGPKLSQALRDSGVWSFDQLALLDDQTLNQALQKANARISNAKTWKKQAELAAREDWEGLEGYQEDI